MHQGYLQHLAESTVNFGRFLRAQGFSADMRQVFTALESLSVVDISDQRIFTSTLQSCLCTTPEEWERFPELFAQFWCEAQPLPRSAAGQNSRVSGGKAPPQHDGSSAFLHQPRSQTEGPEEMARAVLCASAQQRLTRVDFSELPYEDLARLEEIALRLLHRMSVRLSRKLARRNRGKNIDLRRSIRRSITHGGDPISLVRRARKPERSKLVLLLDVSGSMNFYSFFLLRFAWALQAHFHRVYTFLFATEVVEVSDLLRARHLHDALQNLTLRPAEWSGGTRIGESLRQFNRVYAAKILSHDTIFIILSDGWDTGEPELLATQMRFTSRRVCKVLWLNPLLGLKDYQPITRGMATALPYVSVFAPAHNLESLLALEKHLYRL